MPLDYVKECRLVKQRCDRLSITPTKNLWIVSIADQAMAFIKNDELSRQFSISTSKKPPSCVENSYGTPTGLHCAADKIGDGAPMGMVFKGRQPIGRHFSELPTAEQERCLITTRIIRLRGLEEGINAGPGLDTYDRYVYIHGTNHESRIGTPFSAGCVTLSNADVVTVFNLIHEDDLITIVA